jgi:H+-transporting ATPase
MPLMIWIAAIVEAAIQNWLDCSILLAIQLLNASLAFYEITKAGDSIAALKASLKPVAHVRRDGKCVDIDAAYLVPGDCVVLVSGGAVPADCIINEGQVDIDQVIHMCMDVSHHSLFSFSVFSFFFFLQFCWLST